jgi:hypothetical protein
VAGAGITFKGTVATFSSLPGTGNNYGDLWITNDTGHGWIWSTGAVPSFVQKAYIQAGTAASTTITYANAQMSADTNVIAITYGRSGANPITVTVSSVTDTAGNTYTASPLGLVQQVGGGSDGVGTIIYYCSSINAWTAGNAVTVTLSGTANFLAVEILEYAGLAGLDVSVSAKVNSPGASTAINSGSATTTAVNDLIFGFCCGWDGGLAGGSGFTVRNAVYLILVEDKAAPSIGAYNVTGTAGGTNGWAAQLLAFKAAASSWTDSGLWRGPPGPTAVSTDAGNIATLGSDSLILVPQSSIWWMRTRAYSSVGNSTFEVDQVHVGNPFGLGAGSVSTTQVDRWTIAKTAATATLSNTQTSNLAKVPGGPNFYISQKALSIGVTTAQATLAASEYLIVQQQIEGPRLRELLGDVHSLQLLVYSAVAGTFTAGLRTTSSPFYSFVSSFTLAAATWTMVTIPNIPVWASGGTWSTAPGTIGYLLGICLGAGSSYIAPSGASAGFQSGNFLAAPGQTNLMATTSGQFLISFVQHEPGALCTTPIDCPFTGPNGNYEDCLRYYCKSFDYDIAVGTANAVGSLNCIGSNPVNTNIPGAVRWPKSLAKIPAVAIYNASTGAVNSVWNVSTGSSYTVSSAGNIGKSGFGWFTVSGTPTAVNQWYNFHYTADTGW